MIIKLMYLFIYYGYENDSFYIFLHYNNENLFVCLYFSLFVLGMRYVIFLFSNLS